MNIEPGERRPLIDGRVASIVTAQQHAYGYIHDRIVAGEFAGGMRLKADDIAAALQISRMPVREALRQLDAEGLVTITPNRGARVTNLTPSDVLELFEIRALLEAYACRAALDHLTTDAVAGLDTTLTKMKEATTNPPQWIELHDNFHNSLCRLGGRPIIFDRIITLQNQVRPYLRIYSNTHLEPEITGYEHDKIMNSLKGGDPENVEKVMRAHIIKNGQTIAEFLKIERRNYLSPLMSK